MASASYSAFVRNTWIFPEGRLDYYDARDKPWSKDAAIDRLTNAERVYGIKH